MSDLVPLTILSLFRFRPWSSSAEQWDDFTNNFATDLAPIIALFGEQVTKQFLSESTSVLDNIIFGVAPLGILTAVVSVIRVYGNASLKSFIGRAQEAHGMAEAELCSCTSHDVCELWSNGGICRVFGRPKILEFFFSRRGDFYPEFAAQAGNKDKVLHHPSCGIQIPRVLLSSSKRQLAGGDAAAVSSEPPPVLLSDSEGDDAPPPPPNIPATPATPSCNSTPPLPAQVPPAQAIPPVAPIASSRQPVAASLLPPAGPSTPVVGNTSTSLSICFSVPPMRPMTNREEV